MNLWALLTINLVLFTITCAMDSTFSFSSEKELLSKCIESNLLKSKNLYEEIGIAKDMADMIANRFSEKSMDKKDLYIKVNSLFYQLRTNRIHHPFRNDQLFSTGLQKVVKKSLEDCAGDLNLITAEVFEGVSSENVDEPLTGQVDSWIIASQDIASYSECVENYLLNTNHCYKKNEVAKNIAQLFGKRFSKAFLNKEQFFKAVSDLYSKLRFKRIFQQISGEVSLKNLEVTVKKALDYCFDDIRIVTDVPTFETELPEMSDVLDYILVNWPFQLNHMIRTRSGRALLRSYANNAQIVLERALQILNDIGGFRILLREAWLNRAQNFYDGNDIQLPYIPHRYTLNHPRPYMVGDLDIFSTRAAMNFSNRNPPLPRWYLYNILNIHSTDRTGSGEYDIFVEYQRNNLRSAEYYFENQINQFYRILFFFRELSIRGISTDHDDHYNETLAYELIPEDIQDIFDDNTYREYLLNRRRNETSIENVDNIFRQNLANTARVREEDLVVVWANTPSTSDIQFRSTTSRSSTMTSISTTVKYSSTTSKSRKRSNKEDSFVNQNDENLIKHARTSFSGSYFDNDSENININTENMKFKKLCLEKQYNHCVTDPTFNDAINFCFAESMLTQHFKANYLNYGYILHNIKFFLPSQALVLEALEVN